MNRVLVFTSVTVLFILAEPLLIEMFPSLNLAPPEFGLLAVLYMAYAVKESTYQGAAGSVALGYVMDLLCGAPVGVFSFVYVVLYFLFRLLSGKVFARSVVVQTALGAAISALAGVTVVSLDEWLSPVNHSWASLSQIPMQAFVTGITAPLYFYVLWLMDRRISYEASSEGVFR